MRKFLVVATAILAAPSGASGQIDLTVNFGVHLDRLDQPHRRIATSDAEIYSARGEAPTFGVRAAYWFDSRFGLEAGVATSQNQSWEGSAGQPIPVMNKRTTFASFGAAWRPFDVERRLQLRLGLGPSVIVHHGSGESLLARQWDLGVQGSAGVHLRVSESLRLGVDLQNYRFKTDFRQAYAGGGRTISNGEVIPRSEWLVLPAIRWTP